jgi:acyl-CoA thioester hydrolase
VSGPSADPAGGVFPLDTGGRPVPAEWIDYNGHMMDAYYFAAFTEATEALLDHVGLGTAYRAETGCGMYTAESRLCFARSVGQARGSTTPRLCSPVTRSGCTCSTG